MSISDMTVSSWTPTGKTGLGRGMAVSRRNDGPGAVTGTITPCLTFFNKFMWSKAKMLKLPVE